MKLTPVRYSAKRLRSTFSNIISGFTVAPFPIHVVVVSKSPVICAGLCALIRQGVNCVKLTSLPGLERLELDEPVDLFLVEWFEELNREDHMLHLSSSFPKAEVWFYSHQAEHNIPIWVKGSKALWFTAQHETKVWFDSVNQLCQRRPDRSDGNINHH